MAFLWRDRRRPIIILALLLALFLALAAIPQPALQRVVDGLLAQRTLVAMLLLFGLLVVSLLWSAGQELDIWLFLLINVRGRRARVLDRAMWLITQLGNGLTAAALAAAALAIGYRRLAIEIVLGGITGWLIVETIKALVDRARPYRRLAEARIVGWRARGRSFPSGHTSQAFFLAALLAQHFRLSFWASATVYGLAALVGFTRMYVGAHYPRDVLGGMIIGWVWGTVGALVDHRWM